MFRMPIQKVDFNDIIKAIVEKTEKANRFKGTNSNLEDYSQQYLISYNNSKILIEINSSRWVDKEEEYPATADMELTED